MFGSKYNLISESEELKVETCEVEGSKLLMLKTVDEVVGADPQQLFKLVTDVPLRVKWEAEFAKATKIVKLVEGTPEDLVRQLY